MTGFPFIHRTVRIQDRKVVAVDAPDRDFLVHARATATRPPCVVLLSGGPLRPDGENRFSIAAWDPLAVFISKGRCCRILTPKETLLLDASPFDILDLLTENLEHEQALAVSPFSGGAVGYFAYELKNLVEHLPQTASDDLDLPDVFLLWPKRILVHDRLKRELTFLRLSTGEESLPPVRLLEQPTALVAPDMSPGTLSSNFSRHEYLDAVRKVRRYILNGDAYQVNLSQRYHLPFSGDAFELWITLFELNPAPFYAFIHAGDHQVLSTSMERFLYRRGDYLETRPIKGTRRRGASVEEDSELIRDLLESPKDDAELSMIVDLLRNDFGRVCLPGTVRVADHKRLESYRNIHHLVSIVTGSLRPGVTWGELLRATFPGGSITGCPKIRAMEIIDELEPHVRHVYTGAIGYLGAHANLDLNVAIRTAIAHGQVLYYSVGGGIVYDSDEADEYNETLHKARTLFQWLESTKGRST